jgi:hypothetical protein
VRLNARDGWWQDKPPNFPADAIPVGYAWMVRQRALDVMPNHRWSFVVKTSKRHAIEFQDLTWEAFPSSYAPSALTDQLEFALKYDGVNLEVLRAWFDTLRLDEVEAIEAWVRESPTSAYARRAWFLYELLTGRELDVPGAATGGYVPVLDPEDYFTAAGRRSRRHRVVDNLTGGRDFCALVRRTRALARFGERKLHERVAAILGAHDADTLARASSYLYTRETRSSFEIERETPTADRARHFVAVLRQAHDWPELTDAEIVALQNLVVADPRSRERDYRDVQNYVGSSRDVALVAPRPGDLDVLMAGWLSMLGRLMATDVDPVVAAAAASFSFVYLHPFEDGNGRIHRFLIHYVLARKRFTPPGSLVPVSATMLPRMKEYDAALERFSVPLLVRLRYEMDGDGHIEVLHDSSGFYRYPDLTAQAEALYGWVAESIENDIPKELTFLLAYREARQRVAELVELPDRLADQFVLRVMEQRGRLSKHRRNKEFARLTEKEASQLEAAVRKAMSEHGMEVVG